MRGTALQQGTADRPFRPGHSSHLLLVLFVALVGGLGTAGYLYYLGQKEQMRNQDQHELAAIADIKISQISTWREDCVGDAEIMVGNLAMAPRLRRILEEAAPPNQETGLLEWVAALGHRDEYKSAVLLDNRGRMRTALVPGRPDPGTHAAGVVAEAMRNGRPVLSDLHRSAEWPAIHMDLVLPVAGPSASARPSGAVLLEIDPTLYLYPLVQTWPTPSRTGETLLVRREGEQVLYLNELRHRGDTALSLRLPAGARGLIAARAVGGFEGTMEGVDYRGIPVLAAVRRVPGRSWFLIAKIETEEIYAPIRQRARFVALIVGLMIAASGAIVGFLWRSQRATFYQRHYEAELERNALVEHYNSLGRYANDIVLLLDAEGRILEANDRAVSSYRYSREELLRLKIVDLRAPETLGRFQSDWERVSGSDGILFETIHRRKDGSTFPVEVSSREMGIEGVQFRQSIIRDITERKQAEDELRRNQHFLRQILETTPNLLYIYDLIERRTVYVNREVTALPGYSPGGVASMGNALFERLLHPDDIPRMMDYHRRMGASEEGSIFEIEYRMKHVSGAWHWLHSRDVVFARDTAGAATQILGAAEDITDRKRAQESLSWQARTNEAVADLAAAMLSKSSFDEISDLVLSRAQALTGSACGFVAHIDLQTGQVVWPAFTKGGGETCDVDDRDIAFRELRGLWGWVLENKQPLLTNQAQADPRAGGTPAGRVPILQFLSAPAMIGGVVAGQIALANPGRDYDERDLAVVERLARLYALAVQRMHQETALREGEASLARAQRIAHLGDWELDLANGEGRWSDEVYRIFGVPRDFRVTRDRVIACMHPDDRDSAIEAINSAISKCEPYDIQHRVIRGDGTERVVREHAEVVCDGAGNPVRMVGTVLDVTEYRRLEEQLLHAQKMEAIGRLAGGVAHDFNNLLTVINGYSQLCLDRLDELHPVRRDLIEIHGAGQRAAALTRQLLAFSRSQLLQPRVLDLNAIIIHIERMLRRLIGEDIDLATVLSPTLGRVKVDAGQIEQVVMNLAVNARDAMPEGGKLTIETANVVLDESYAQKRVGVRPGPYVMLAMSDTGLGMDPKTQSRIFEPFFTTKPKGKGTGLGLSTVYGIVKQSGGEIWLYSEPGRGTCFKIYLPSIEAVEESAAPAIESPPPGSETILVVEDEEGVRSLTRKILENAGYSVLEAANAEEALLVRERYAGTIHLMVTDVVMPGLSGRELAMRLEPVWPAMRVLFISGYTDNAIVHHGVLDEGLHFIQKPFTPQALTRKVAELLRDQTS